MHCYNFRTSRLVTGATNKKGTITFDNCTNWYSYDKYCYTKVDRKLQRYSDNSARYWGLCKEKVLCRSTIPSMQQRMSVKLRSSRDKQTGTNFTGLLVTECQRHETMSFSCDYRGVGNIGDFFYLNTFFLIHPFIYRLFFCHNYNLKNARMKLIFRDIL